MERNIIDDPTGMDSNDKSGAWDFVLHNISQVYYNADQWETVSEEKRDITPRELDSSLMELRYDQNLPIKNIKVDSVEVSDSELVSMIHDYTQTYPEGTYYNYPQKIYFIEGGVSAIVIIPIAIKKGLIGIHMELFFRSPQFIQSLKEENKKSFSKLNLPKLSSLLNKENKGD